VDADGSTPATVAPLEVPAAAAQLSATVHTFAVEAGAEETSVKLVGWCSDRALRSWHVSWSVGVLSVELLSGTRFARFTGTRVQILTQKVLSVELLSGTHSTCFTSTTVQILTQKVLSVELLSGTKFARFTSTRVQILTQKVLSQNGGRAEYWAAWLQPLY
jgi:hypothetical protein